jgi:hypothetical protein
MSVVVASRTDEPCPVCGTGLIVLDDGATIAAECRLCGWAEVRTGGEGE